MPLASNHDVICIKSQRNMHQVTGHAPWYKWHAVLTQKGKQNAKNADFIAVKL